MDANGDPYVGLRYFFYAAGTSTKVDTQTDSTGSTNNTNPVVFDAEGYPDGNVMIYGPNNTGYKIVAALPGTDDPPLSPLWTIDNIYPGVTVNGEWINPYDAVYVSATSFKIVGVDVTSLFNNGRRVYLQDTASSANDRYGTITAQVFGTDTTISVDVDGSNTLHADMDLAFIGINSGNAQSSAINYYPEEAGEIGVIDLTYPIGNIKRYGALTTSSDNSTALQNAVDSALLLNSDCEIPLGVFDTAIPLVIDRPSAATNFVRIKGPGTIREAASFTGDRLIHIQTTITNSVYVIFDGITFTGVSSVINGIDCFKTAIAYNAQPTLDTDIYYMSRIRIINCVFSGFYIANRITGNQIEAYSSDYSGNICDVHMNVSANTISYYSCNFREFSVSTHIKVLDSGHGTLGDQFINCIWQAGTGPAIWLENGPEVAFFGAYFEANGSNNTAAAAAYLAFAALGAISATHVYSSGASYGTYSSRFFTGRFEPAGGVLSYLGKANATAFIETTGAILEIESDPTGMVIVGTITSLTFTSATDGNTYIQDGSLYTISSNIGYPRKVLSTLQSYSGGGIDYRNDNTQSISGRLLKRTTITNASAGTKILGTITANETYFVLKATVKITAWGAIISGVQSHAGTFEQDIFWWADLDEGIVVGTAIIQNSAIRGALFGASNLTLVASGTTLQLSITNIVNPSVAGLGAWTTSYFEIDVDYTANGIATFTTNDSLLITTDETDPV